MKTYKHKKSGIKVRLKNGLYHSDTILCLPPSIVESSNEWEQYEDKGEFEILEFKKTSVWKKIDEDEFQIQDTYSTSSHIISAKALFDIGAVITSVKRLSDGHIFSIGDVVRYNNGTTLATPFTIYDFFEKPNGKLLVREEFKRTCEYLESLEYNT